MLSPEQRLQALEELEKRQQRTQTLALRAVWTSIVVAALVLGAIIGFATWQLKTVRSEVDSLNDKKTRLQNEITELGKQKEAIEKQRMAAAGALANVPETQLKQAIDRQFATAPQTAALLPRIYMQIVDRADSARAQKIRKALQDAGYLVLGIEYVPSARGLKTTDVRFYRATERAEAEKIAQAVKNAGEPNVNVNYLRQFENSTSARPNHFEVWLAHTAE